MHHLGQPVDNNENRVITIAFPVRTQRQYSHKVYREVLPSVSRYRQGLQITIGLMSDRLQSQTNVTSSDIALDISSQARPIVFPTAQLSCLVNTKMSCKRIIMVTTYHLGTDDFWDVKESLILEYSFDVFPALLKAPSSQHFCLFVVILQFGES